MPFEPAYRNLLRTGELKQRAELAWQHIECCDLCARRCRINRRLTTKGSICQTGEQAIVHSYGPHHGEEDPLRGRMGSGTIFFSQCNLRCIFCQNWEISHKGVGRTVTPDELATMMMELEAQGCHNINFVSPSHVVAPIIAAVSIAAEKGLTLPLVYNTGGYDSIEALQLLDGIIDIYMPDMKYGDSEMGFKLSRARDYVEVNQAAVREMHRQVGDLELDARGVALRGLLIRHLVLPQGCAGTEQVAAFLAREISPNAYLNVMDQYRSCYKADEYPPIDRFPTRAEYNAALEICEKYGLRRLDRRLSRLARIFWIPPDEFR